MNSYETIIAIYVFVFGLCVGSFLNVLVLRGLKGEDFIFSRSKCPKCNKQLKWYMNIPLLSYIFLKGKCAYCSCKISFQYPLVEFLTGAFFIILYLNYGLSLKTLLLDIIFAFFIVISTSDFKERVIIDWHGYGLGFVSLIYSYFYFDISVALKGAIISAIIFELFSRLGKVFVKQRFFGDGDTIIVFALGALFGLKLMPFVIFLSLIIQSLISIPLIVIKEFKKNKMLAFAYVMTFLAMILLFIKKELLYPCILVLILALVFILKDIKKKRGLIEVEDDFDNSVYNLVPFAPALIFSGVFFIFFEDKIVAFLNGIFM